MKVWVVMGNDYPDSVFDNVENAERYCDAKKKEKTDAAPGYRRMIYWRTYEFDLRGRQ